MAKKLFVGGLSWDTTNQSLSDFFSQAGNVVSANVITDKFSGKSRGFGFVEMSNDEEADKAIQQLNGQSLDGRTIVVNEAKPLEPRDRNFSGGSRNFGGRDSRGGGRDNRGGRDFRNRR